jgi:hypothetical protein
MDGFFDSEGYDLFCMACGIAIIVGPMWFGISRMLKRKPKLHFGASRCCKCGYDLRATKGRCPECGLITRMPPFV